MAVTLPPPLISLSPGTLAAGAPSQRTSTSFLRAVGRAFEAGLPGILLRERGSSERAFGELLTAVLRMAEPHDAWVGVHDRAHFASAREETDFSPRALHLGFRSLEPALARRVIGDGVALGLSTHAQDDEESWRAADYLFHGPVHPTPSKDGLQAAIGFEGLASAVARARAVGAPALWAIGGLRPEDAGPARRAGAAGLVVLRGILADTDPGAATRRYLAAWDGAGA